LIKTQPTPGKISVEQKVYYALSIELGLNERSLLDQGQELNTNVQTKDGFLTVTIRNKSA